MTREQKLEKMVRLFRLIAESLADGSVAARKTLEEVNRIESEPTDETSWDSLTVWSGDHGGTIEYMANSHVTLRKPGSDAMKFETPAEAAEWVRCHKKADIDVLTDWVMVNPSRRAVIRDMSVILYEGDKERCSTGSMRKAIAWLRSLGGIRIVTDKEPPHAR